MSAKSLEDAKDRNIRVGLHLARCADSARLLFVDRPPTGPENHLLLAVQDYQECVGLLLDHIGRLEAVAKAAKRYSEWEFNDFAYDGHIPEGLLEDRRTLRRALLDARGD